VAPPIADTNGHASPASTPDWLSFFAARGYPQAAPLADGMEGTVYSLGTGLVAKVWKRRRQHQLLGLQAFYEELAAAGLGFATPRLREIWEEEGVAITVESRLPGVPLDSVRPLDQPLREDAIRCMLDVLDGLRTAGDLAIARQLPVLGEPSSMWEGAGSWPAALASLLDRRLALHGDQLRACVPGFEAIAARLRARIAELEAVALTVVHGDLIPANVLVDDELRPQAVLDFGFFTTAGDPLFDLAVTASVYDMYGPRAAESEAAIDHAAAERWDRPPERLALYRAAYAAITASAYDPTGQDGHFHWCVEMLRRDDVAAL
jgi:aminoglycoside phosphotransferase